MSDNHTFYINNKSESIIHSIEKDDIFIAKTVDNELITDKEGNSLFKAVDVPKFEHPMGWYVSCIPIKDKILKEQLLKKGE